MPRPPQPWLVAAFGSAGDLHPFLRVARTLQSRGHRVVFFTNAYLLDGLRDSGLELVGLGSHEHYQRIIANPDLWHPRRGMGVVLADYADLLLEFEQAVRARVGDTPGVIVAHPLSVAGAVMARERGLATKVVSMHLAPSTLRTCHDPLRIGDVAIARWVPKRWRRALWRAVDRRWIDPVAAVPMNRARATLDLPPVHGSYVPHLQDAPDLTVTLFPAWFAPGMPDWPQPRIEAHFPLYDARANEPMSPDLQAFLAAGPAPIVCTAGTANRHTHRFYDGALAACAALGARAIVLTADRSQLPATLPATVHWQPYVPLATLLPHARLLVHHGGIGTVAEALRAATPQVAVPFAWDQFDNAARVEELGVGRAVKAARLDPQRLAAAMRELLAAPSVAARCREISGRFAADGGLDAICEQVEAQV